MLTSNVITELKQLFRDHGALHPSDPSQVLDLIVHGRSVNCAPNWVQLGRFITYMREAEDDRWVHQQLYSLIHGFEAADTFRRQLIQFSVE